jgi:glycosyltransferase involved in cell wall biosynthesis
MEAKDTTPKVLVISPYYKRKDSVERTLRSISEQTYGNFKALIWDDGSNDGTYEELCRVQAILRDDRIEVVGYGENIGLTKGLNRAIESSEADYVAVVGSGDICKPNRLECQVDALLANPKAVFCASAAICEDEVTGRLFYDESYDKSTIEQADIVNVVPFTHGSVMYRKSAIDQVGLYEESFKWCADWDMFFRLLNIGNAIYISDVLYHRFATTDGVSFNPVKSLEQIRYKYFAKSLQGLGAAERKERILEARSDLEEYLRPYREAMCGDLVKRQIKLSLMRRRCASRELTRLVRQEFDVSITQKIMMSFANYASRLPFDLSTLVDTARAFARIVRV